MMRRVVALLLCMYPAHFRRRFGTDLRTAFEERWREQAGWRFALRTVADLVLNAALEHLTEPLTPQQFRGESTMTTFRRDLRIAARMLMKTPGFTSVTLVTLALGIGVNTAMFSVANAVVWRSLSYRQPDRLVVATEAEAKIPDVDFGVSYPNYLDWKAQAHAFENLAAVLRSEEALREGSDPLRLTGVLVTRNFFDVLGIRPELGRGFTEAEDRPGGNSVIVLSHRIWMQQFAGNARVIGGTIHLDESSPIVVGVMPASFDYPLRCDYWVPLGPLTVAPWIQQRSVYVLSTVGRLREGKSLREAVTELEGTAAQIRRSYPETNRGLVIRVTHLRDSLSGRLRLALLVLMGAACLVLLIACSNLAGLMMARACSRTQEMAIRAALGAGNRRLILQLLTESALLSAAGGVLGLALAVWATHSLRILSKDPELVGVTVDGTVLLFALAATMMTSVLFGIAPALQAAGVDAGQALKQGGTRTGWNRRHTGVRQFLVVAEVALCLVLLTGAGLLFRSFRSVLAVDPGFRTEHLVTMRIGLPDTYKTAASVVSFYSRMQRQLRTLPGLVDVSASSSLPISGGDPNGDLTIEGRPMREGEKPAASFRRVLPNYFRTMGIPLVGGREFNERDDGTQGKVTIINESMARRLWPGENPVGKRIKIGLPTNEPWLTIVGVVKDVRQVGLDSEISFSTYDPLAQRPWSTVWLAVRTAADPAATLAAVRDELRGMEPVLLIENAGTMAQRIGDSVAPRRLNLILFGLFAGLALVLALVGLYGVVAYGAGQRTREFGVRLALGASRSDVLWLVLGQGLKLALAGVALGMAATLGLARLLVNLLFGVAPTDPLTVAGAALLVTMVALLACWLPAYRATLVNPIAALRIE